MDTVAPVRDRLYYEKEEVKQVKTKKGRRDKENYYSEEGKSLGFYCGEGTKRLGLHGEPILVGDLEKLTNGIHPRTGEVLWKMRKPSKNKKDKNIKVEQTDSCFGAVKDFTLMELFDGKQKEQYKVVFDRAFNRAIDEMPSRVYRRLNSKNQKAFDCELIQMYFDHGTNRGVDDVPDPHRHRHCLTFKKCFTEDGSIKTIDNFGLFNNQKFFGAVFRAELANGLREMGFEIVKNKIVKVQEEIVFGKQVVNEFKIKGISKEIINAFSTRNIQILATAKEKGKISGRDLAFISQNIKRAKQSWDSETLLNNWKERGEKLGINEEFISNLKTFSKVEIMNNVKLEHEIIKSSLCHGKLYESKLLLRLAESEQYTGINYKEFFQHLQDKGIIKREQGFLFSHTLDLTKTTTHRKHFELRKKTNPNSLISTIMAFSTTMNMFETLVKALTMSALQINEITNKTDIKQPAKKTAKKSVRVSTTQNLSNIKRKSEIAHKIYSLGLSIGELESKLFDINLDDRSRFEISAQLEQLKAQQIQANIELANCVDSDFSTTVHHIRPK